MRHWFETAGFGIFLHWGIYSVAGIEASWPFFHGRVPREEYFGLASQFGAERFEPLAWARFFRSIGARYVVLTAKHHDGVALWPSEQPGALRIDQVAPSGSRRRDLVGAFCEGMRAEGLRVGLYFSHADWRHPDYASVRNHGIPAPGANALNARYSYPPEGAPEEQERWEQFLEFHRGQIHELCERYRPDLLWFDGDWERSPAQWRMGELRALIKGWLREVVTNNRLGGLGDYATFEQNVPEAPPAGKWELAETLNHQWAWSPDNSRLKTVKQLTNLSEQVDGMEGNLLLNIGPRADGTFDEAQAERLRELGGIVKGILGA